MQVAETRQTYYDVIWTRFFSLALILLIFFFFFPLYCRVECNFLTLKISGWGAPTFRRQTGCRSRRERSEGWMMRKMKESESERGRVYTRVRVGRANESEKKNRGLKGRITSGILVFAFHLDEKPISRFSVFPATRTGTRIRCLLCEYRDESKRGRSYLLPPTSWRRILSRVRPFNRVLLPIPEIRTRSQYSRGYSFAWNLGISRWTWNTTDKICSGQLSRVRCYIKCSKISLRTEIKYDSSGVLQKSSNRINKHKALLKEIILSKYSNVNASLHSVAFSMRFEKKKVKYVLIQLNLVNLSICLLKIHNSSVWW